MKYPGKVTILTPHAETVAVIPTATGENTLYANVRGYCGPRPCIEFTGVEETVTQVNAYILGANGVFATTESAVRDKMEEVNRIYAQVGMRLVLNTVTNVVIDEGYLSITANNVLEASSNICHIARNTGRLELYFVNSIRVGRGLAYQYYDPVSLEPLGIVVTGMTSVRVIAHEIGHACGFPDIYSNTSPFQNMQYHEVEGAVSKARAGHDWGCESENVSFTGYANQNELIRNLLMNGVDDSFSSSDLPYGDIWGIWKARREAELWLRESPVPVGAAVRDCRHPIHH